MSELARQMPALRRERVEVSCNDVGPVGHEPWLPVGGSLITLTGCGMSMRLVQETDGKRPPDIDMPQPFKSYGAHMQIKGYTAFMSGCLLNLSRVLGLLARPELALAAAFATFSALTATAQTSIALPGDRAFPENIAATRDGAIYIGSLGSGGVYQVAPHSREAKSWIKPGAFGTHSVFGVLADEKSNTLWVCSNDLSAMGVIISGSDGVSELKGFDLKTGEGKISAALPGSPALCNDITIGPDGAAYVTNSMSPQILRLAPGGKALEVWFTDPALQPANGAGLDGLAFGPDGNLYVDRYTPGDLYRVNVKSGKATGITRLSPSRPLVLADAIRRFGKDRFLIIEGGGRLDTLAIRGDKVVVVTLKDGFSVPTGVAAVGKTAWVSEGQLSYIFDPSKKDQRPNLPFRIHSVALPTAH